MVYIFQKLPYLMTLQIYNIVSKDSKIIDLKDTMINCLANDDDIKNNYLLSIITNEFCDETKPVSYYFNNFDLVILKKKSYIEYYMEKLLDSI